MLPHAFVGAMADSLRSIITPLRELCARHSERNGPHFGAAALEFLIRLNDLPGSGDCWEVRSGRAFGTMAVVAICFDLETSRLLPIASTAQAELADWIVPGLAL